MHTSYSSDVAEIAMGFNPFAADVVGSEPTERDEEISVASQREVATALQSSGWVEIADIPDAENGFVMTNAVVEQSALSRFPFPYPIVEELAARRALAHIFARDDRCRIEESSSEAPQLPVLVLEPLWLEALGSTIPDTFEVAVPRAADLCIVLFPCEDDQLAVQLVRPREQNHSHGVATDLTLPLIRLRVDRSSPEPFQTESLGSGPGRSLVAERLCLESAELIGSSSWLFEATLAHLKAREQFGRRLSSFQALQHRMARMMVELETARSLHLRAIARLQAAADDALDVAMLTKGYAATTAKTIADEAIQLHGGMGYTWEAGLHWNVRRIYHRIQPPFSADRCFEGAGRRALVRGHALETAS